MKKPFTKVSKNVGMNPIARAVAKQKLAAAVTDYRISIYLNEHGQEAASDYLTMSAMFDATVGAMPASSELEYRKLKAAISVVNQAGARGWTWDSADTVTLDNALKIVQDEFPKIPAIQANQSIRRVMAV